MNTAQDTIVQLNKYPPERYNVLIPVTSMQIMSNLQKIVVNEVQLNPDPNGNDVYFDKQTGKLAITAVGGTKLAAAANISIIHSGAEQPEVCKRCLEMAKATGQAKPCGGCDHAYDVRYTVSVRVPEPSGGFRIITKSKEIDCALERGSMSEAQYKRFLPHRGSMAETKAYMRCLRSALGLSQGYTREEIRKPFVIAHIVPNLDAPDMRKALIGNSLRDMGLLFEMPSAQQETPALTQGTKPGLPESASADFGEGEYQDADSGGFTEAEYPDYPEEPVLPWDEAPEQPAPQGIVCADCGKQIAGTNGTNGRPWTPEAIRDYSMKWFKRCLCPDCQRANKRAITSNGRRERR